MPQSAVLIHPEFQAALTSPESFTTTLMAILVDTYGTAAFNDATDDNSEWDAEALVMQIERDFNIKLPHANGDRIMAGIALLTSDDFYKSVPDFINICNVLAGDTYDPRSWDPADAGEIAWGITEALLLAPPDDNDEEPFVPEILGYIGKVLDAEGIVHPPDVLKIAVRESDMAARVNQYSDDPEMFDAIYDLETAKTEDINNTVSAALQLLAQQLDSLPLRNGTTKGVVQQMLQSFASSPHRPEAGSILT